jgi:hypothetical protein
MIIPQIVYKSSATSSIGNGNINISGNVNALNTTNINSSNNNNNNNSNKIGSTQTTGKNTYLLYLFFLIV